MHRATIGQMFEDGRQKTVVDMRLPEEYETDTVPQAINISWKQFDPDCLSLPKDRPLYLICYNGEKSDDQADRLHELGYEVYSIEGGFHAYLRYKIHAILAGEAEDDKASEPGSGRVTESGDGTTSESGSDHLSESGDGALSESGSGRVSEFGEDTPSESGNDISSASKSAGSGRSKKESTLPYYRQVERSIIKKFRKPIWRKFTKAINEYELIQDGDRIAVCISGGKDSMLMAKLFQELSRHGKKNFEPVFLVMNPGYNDINYETICNNAALLHVPIIPFRTEIYDIVAADGMTSPCYLCARMRRGYLYSKARDLGCNKIALGHHYDDVIETIVMGMFYGSQIQTMMPKLHSTHFEGMELIRPLYLIRERDIIRWRDFNKLHFIQCACRLTESCSVLGEEGRGSKRGEIKALIRQLEEKDPIIAKNIFRSMENVNLATVVAYKKDGVKHHFLENYDDPEHA